MIFSSLPEEEYSATAVDAVNDDIEPESHIRQTSITTPMKSIYDKISELKIKLNYYKENDADVYEQEHNNNNNINEKENGNPTNKQNNFNNCCCNMEIMNRCNKTSPHHHPHNHNHYEINRITNNTSFNTPPPQSHVHTNNIDKQSLINRNEYILLKRFGQTVRYPKTTENVVRKNRFNSFEQLEYDEYFSEKQHNCFDEGRKSPSSLTNPQINKKLPKPTPSLSPACNEGYFEATKFNNEKNAMIRIRSSVNCSSITERKASVLSMNKKDTSDDGDDEIHEKKEEISKISTTTCQKRSDQKTLKILNFLDKNKTIKENKLKVKNSLKLNELQQQQNLLNEQEPLEPLEQHEQSLCNKDSKINKLETDMKELTKTEEEQIQQHHHQHEQNIEHDRESINIQEEEINNNNFNCCHEEEQNNQMTAFENIRKVKTKLENIDQNQDIDNKAFRPIGSVHTSSKQRRATSSSNLNTYTKQHPNEEEEDDFYSNNYDFESKTSRNILCPLLSQERKSITTTINDHIIKGVFNQSSRRSSTINTAQTPPYKQQQSTSRKTPTPTPTQPKKYLKKGSRIRETLQKKLSLAPPAPSQFDCLSTTNNPLLSGEKKLVYMKEYDQWVPEDMFLANRKELEEYMKVLLGEKKNQEKKRSNLQLLKGSNELFYYM